jgi:hypothetical protein
MKVGAKKKQNQFQILLFLVQTFENLKSLDTVEAALCDQFGPYLK